MSEQANQQIILFYQNTPFSQWFNSPFTIDNINYINAEQYMMAEKARLFKDDIVLKKIMKTSSPKTIKSLGRKISNFNGSVWDQYKYDIIIRGNHAKFSQNLNLKQFLLTTDNDIIAEASPYDKIWGIGMSSKHPDAYNPKKWKGLNLLGKALMEIRDLLKLN